MQRMYSAVPGRVYMATRGHSAGGDKELTLNKGDRVKGEVGLWESKKKPASDIILNYCNRQDVQWAVQWKSASGRVCDT